MEFVRKLFVQVQEHLGTLGVRDKLLFTLLLAVMVATFVWVVQSTATPELVPLLDQDMPAGEIVTIENQLERRNVTYRVEGNRILVRRQERDRLLAELELANALPNDTREGWQKLILESDWTVSAQDRQHRQRLALELRLAQVLRQMPNVRAATVIINTGSPRSFIEGPSGDPTASVHLTMRSGVNKPSKKLILAVARMVAGAVDRLTSDHVNIVVGGASYRVPDEDSAFSSDMLDTYRNWERHYVDKIVRTLGIQNALVGVDVELETEQILIKKEQYGPEVVSEERTRESTSARGDKTGEPGVRPNTGNRIAAGGGSEETSTDSETETKFDGKRDKTVQQRQNLPGEVKSVRATVNVPKSYLVGIFKTQTDTDEPPSAEDFENIFQEQRDRIRDKVLPLVRAKDPKQVEVDWYYDEHTVSSAVAIAADKATASLPVMQYAKPAGLAVLALSSLMMVLMMMRKAASGVGIPGPEDVAASETPPPMLEAGSAPVGEAGQTDGVLHGVEVDEDTVRAKKMSEQVATLVKEDPDAAAALVKQWISQSQ